MAALLVLRPALAEETITSNERIFEFDQLVEVLREAASLEKRGQFEKEREYRNRIEGFLHSKAGTYDSWYLIGHPNEVLGSSGIIQYDPDRELVLQKTLQADYTQLVDFNKLKGPDAEGPRLQFISPVQGDIEVPLSRETARAQWQDLRLVGLVTPVLPYFSFQKNSGAYSHPDFDRRINLQTYHAQLSKIALINIRSRQVLFSRDACLFSDGRSFRVQKFCSRF